MNGLFSVIVLYHLCKKCQIEFTPSNTCNRCVRALSSVAPTYGRDFGVDRPGNRQVLCCEVPMNVRLRPLHRLRHPRATQNVRSARIATLLAALGLISILLASLVGCSSSSSGSSVASA